MQYALVYRFCLVAFWLGVLPSLLFGRAGVIFESKYMEVKLEDEKNVSITSLFGQEERISEPLLIELLKSPSLARLASIRQHGNWYYCANPAEYSRLEHSINVFLLVRKSGGSILEQVAALLHDVSHTAFSHSGASFFTDDFLAADHWQDQMHEYYIESSDLKGVLDRYDIKIEDILPDENGFSRLERELPDLCADRIEYNITGGLYEGFLTREQAEQLVRAIHFLPEHDSWCFDSIDAASLFSRNSIYMTIGLWTSPYSVVSSKMLGYALRRAVQLGLITRDDVLTGSDGKVFQILTSSDDLLMQKFVQGLLNPHTVFSFAEKGKGVVFCKFRGVNPLVMNNGALYRLSDLNRSFAWYYAHMQDLFSRGWPVAYEAGVLEAIANLS